MVLGNSLQFKLSFFLIASIAFTIANSGIVEKSTPDIVVFLTLSLKGSFLVFRKLAG